MALRLAERVKVLDESGVELDTAQSKLSDISLVILIHERWI